MATKTTGFRPNFQITPGMVRDLMRIEAVRQAVESLPITPRVLASLRETARLVSTHYSTLIEGNRLTQEQVARVIAHSQPAPGRERDRDEVRGYYAALEAVERNAREGGPVTEKMVQTIHALVMARGRARVRPTAYRDGQNVIKDSRSGGIVYMPPEARDVPSLMAELLAWLAAADGLPVPLKAAIAHYQFATVHPYYDGNGRTARLLTTLILHRGGYGLKGLYALEEYYARDLTAYYAALSIGPSHNYYLGRAGAEITAWIAYFIEGMAVACENVHRQATREAASGAHDRPELLRALDARQRKAITLFKRSREVAAKEVAALFGLQRQAGAALCRKWVASGFLAVADPSKKARRYRLVPIYEDWIAGRNG